MPSRLEIILAIAVFAIALAAVSLIMLEQNPPESCGFEALEEGIKFCSEEKEPALALRELSDLNEFVVAIYQSKGDDFSFAANTMISFQSILSANRKSSTLLVIEQSGGTISSCQTNYGLPQMNEEISPAECEKILDSNKAFVFINKPDPSLSQASVEVGLRQKTINLKPKAASEMQAMALITLKAMFSGSEQTIARINELLKGIQGV